MTSSALLKSGNVHCNTQPRSTWSTEPGGVMVLMAMSARKEHQYTTSMGPFASGSERSSTLTSKNVRKKRYVPANNNFVPTLRWLGLDRYKWIRRRDDTCASITDSAR